MKKSYQLQNLKNLMNNRYLVGIYPGTFDPVTFGHLDIVSRATHIVDKLIISVAENEHKKPLFSVEERIQMIKDALIEQKINSCEIDIIGFDNLLVEHAKNIERR